MTAAVHIAVLINPVSGAGKSVIAGEELKKELAERKIHFTFFAGDWPQELSAFSEAWIAGGDGTVNYFINQYRHALIPFAVFKGGTGNDFAWKLYGDIPLKKQVALVLAAQVKKIDAAQCNGKLYVNSLGIGFDGEVLQGMNTVRRLGGHLGYLFIVLKKIFSFKEYSFRITTAAETFHEKFLLVIINNSSRTGGGFMVSPKASLTDGLLDLVLCKKLPVLKRLRYLPAIEKGKHVQLSFIHYAHEQSVTVVCEREVYAQLDGDLIAAKEFEIAVLKDALPVKY